ncbi:MAG: hypothetical protein QG641_2420 [Candidatus Poribacteria bacterium]|nr:hypothetical protein [Candidatus Poribacteria bacterium]
MSKLIITSLFLAISISFVYGCSNGDSETANDNYYYPETQNILFFGTWELNLEITSNVSQPSFAWQATGLKYVVITVFDSKIDLKNNQIANPEDAVWTWNTNMGRGREGNIGFSDGRDMRLGVIQDTVTSLKPGVYYISAWAYDNNYNLIRSSKEYRFEYNPSL